MDFLIVSCGRRPSRCPIRAAPRARHIVAPHPGHVTGPDGGRGVDVAPDRLACRAGDTDDLECSDDSLAPRVTALEVVEGVVHSRSEVRRLEALSEIQGRLATQELVNLVSVVLCRMACGRGHAATPFRF